MLSRALGLQSSKPFKRFLPSFCSNTITLLVTCPRMAPWVNQFLNTSLKISTNMGDSRKFISYGKPSSSDDLLRPNCFDASWTSLSVIVPTQEGASAALGARKIGQIAGEFLYKEVWQLAETITEIRSEVPTNIRIQTKSVPIRGNDTFDVPTGIPQLFLKRIYFQFHCFIGTLFNLRSNYKILIALNVSLSQFYFLELLPFTACVSLSCMDVAIFTLSRASFQQYLILILYKRDPHNLFSVTILTNAR